MDKWNAWIPVTNPKEFPSSRDIDKLEINISNSSLPFLAVGDGDSYRQGGGGEVANEEPVEVIIFRVIFALLISISLLIIVVQCINDAMLCRETILLTMMTMMSHRISPASKVRQ